LVLYTYVLHVAKVLHAIIILILIIEILILLLHIVQIGEERIYELVMHNNELKLNTDYSGNMCDLLGDNMVISHNCVFCETKCKSGKNSSVTGYILNTTQLRFCLEARFTIT